jgi:hypothetical protein
MKIFKIKNTLFRFLIIICFLQSCNKSPECGDSKVTENAMIEFKSQIREQLLKEYYNENINKSDVIDYANENNYTYESVLENEKVKIKDKAELYVTNQLAETKFQNIITKNEDEKIKKCDCEAEIQNTNLVEGLFVVYSAQNTEDGNLKIVLDYIIPH